MTKLLENTFRTVNIGLVNEMALMCDRLGVDVWEVIDAAATKPFGFMKFTPGPGLGGHCIPIDPLYLSWKLKSAQVQRPLHRAGQRDQHQHAALRRAAASRTRSTSTARRCRGSRVLVLGVAYKPDIDDLRESPALDVIGLLRGKGAQVSYHDPYVPSLEHEGWELTSVPDLLAAARDADCVVIVTNHSAIDYAAVAQSGVADLRHPQRAGGRRRARPQGDRGCNGALPGHRRGRFHRRAGGGGAAGARPSGRRRRQPERRLRPAPEGLAPAAPATHAGVRLSAAGHRRRRGAGAAGRARPVRGGHQPGGARRRARQRSRSRSSMPAPTCSGTLQPARAVPQRRHPEVRAGLDLQPVRRAQPTPLPRRRRHQPPALALRRHQGRGGAAVPHLPLPARTGRHHPALLHGLRPGRPPGHEHLPLRPVDRGRPAGRALRRRPAGARLHLRRRHRPRHVGRARAAGLRGHQPGQRSPDRLEHAARRPSSS